MVQCQNMQQYQANLVVCITAYVIVTITRALASGDLTKCVKKLGCHGSSLMQKPGLDTAMLQNSEWYSSRESTSSDRLDQLGGSMVKHGRIKGDKDQRQGQQGPPTLEGIMPIVQAPLTRTIEREAGSIEEPQITTH
jgi:hypothetical protein